MSVTLPQEWSVKEKDFRDWERELKDQPEKNCASEKGPETVRPIYNKNGKCRKGSVGRKFR